MKRLILALVMLVPVCGIAQDSPEWVGYDNRWYVGVMGGVARPGDKRLTDSTAPYFGAYIGRFFSPNFSLDLQVDAYPTDFKRREFNDEGLAFPPDDDLDIYGYGLTGRWHFGAEADRTRPYLHVGLGINEHDSVFDDGRDIYVAWGGGLNHKVGDNLRLRAQVEGRYDNDRETFPRDDGFIDFIASVGIGWSFGALPRAPQPRQEPPPPEPMRRATPPPPAPEPQPVMKFEFDAAVLFAFDSAELRPDARVELDRAANVLAPRDDLVRIDVEGHTDSMGPDDYNQRLSERRANTVADYLASKGIDRDRMRVIGYGESRPKVANDTPANRQQNRRVVITAFN